MKRVLIVIDMQEDFVRGSLGSKDAEAIVSKVKAKITEYMERGDKIIFTRDTHRENYLETLEGKNLPVEHCIYGTEGWRIIPELVDDCKEYPEPLISKAFAILRVPLNKSKHFIVVLLPFSNCVYYVITNNQIKT